MALESSASKQEGGIQPGRFFFLILLRIGASFQKQPVQRDKLYRSRWVCSSIPMPGNGDSPHNLQANAGSFYISFVVLPPPQSPTFAVNPPGIFFFPNKPHRQITDTKDAGQI